MYLEQVLTDFGFEFGWDVIIKGLQYIIVHIHTVNFPLKYTVTTNEVQTKINPLHIPFYTSA